VSRLVRSIHALLGGAPGVAVQGGATAASYALQRARFRYWDGSQCAKEQKVARKHAWLDKEARTYEIYEVGMDGAVLAGKR